MRSNSRILVVEDDRRLREILRKILVKNGFEVEVADNGAEGLMRAKQDVFDVALVDLKMPGMDGIEVLRKLKKISSQTYVVIMTGFGTIDSAVEAMKNGAFEYITKPFKTEEILIVIKRILEHSKLRKKVEYLTKQVERRYKFDEIVGKSRLMQSVFEMIQRVSGTDTTVLITGKTGTGKELVARAIHNHSKRKDKPFVVVNSSAIPDNLLESELFGYLKGAFTGALRDKRGYFQEAHRGTLFLDEIGEIPPSTQVKLLRVIEDRTITPVGGTKGEKVDIRLIVATNHDLQYEVNKGSFRGDLYYRLNVMSIPLPDLGERKEDIPLLTNHFLDKYNHALGKEIKSVSQEALTLLLDYHWPGNVRELEHAMERAVLVCDTEEILEGHLPSGIQYPEEARIRETSKQGKSLQEVEREYINMILRKTGGHKTKAASILGIDRRTLYRKLKNYGIK